MIFSFLVAMIWKSAAIAGAALALAFVVRWRTATDRLILLRAGVAMLLALPLIMAFLPALQIVALPTAPPPPPVAALPLPAALPLGPVAEAASPAITPAAEIDPAMLALLIYGLGVAILAIRHLAGLAILYRWTAAAADVGASDWRDILDGVGASRRIRRRVRLLVSVHVHSPLSWGWRRPVILVDPATLERPGDAEAVLTHEVAHIARRDWPALMMARLAVILFWFNPLVWLLERELIQQSEEAADLEAADRVGAAHYAEKLLGWARFRSRLPVNSIAASPSALGRRVRNILDGRLAEHHGAWARFATLLCVGIAAPIAATQLVAAAPDVAATPPPTPVAPVALPPSAAVGSGAAMAAADPVPPTPAAPAPRDDVGPQAAMAPLPPMPAVPPSPPVAPVPPIPDVGQIVSDALADIPRVQADAAMARSMADAQRSWTWDKRAWDKRAWDKQGWDKRSRAKFEADMRRAQHAMANVPQIIAGAMAGSAAGMETGASQMEVQADNLERMGRQFQTDRAFREREIERARQQGRTVTHEDLIEAGEGMQEGAEGMREGARGMREAAANMRHAGTN